MKLIENANDVAYAIRLIRSGTLAEQMEAIDALHETCGYRGLAEIGLTKAQSKTLVGAVGRKYPAPPNSFSFEKTYRTKLLQILCQSPTSSIADELIRLNQLRTLKHEEHWQLLQLLAQMPQRRAAKTWLRGYRARLRAGKGVPPPFGNWAREGRHCNLLLPALIEFARNENAWLADQWNAHIRQYLQATRVKTSIIDELTCDLDSLLDHLEPFHDRTPGNWMWEQNYFDLRWKAESRINLLGYAPTRKLASLHRALESTDPLLRMSAGLALLKLGAPLRDSIFLAAAQRSETRFALYRQLKQLGKEDLFPRQFAKQQLMAESDLVAWLIDDGDPPPEQLVPAGIVSRRGKRYYVFLFDWSGKKKLGISGPWGKQGLEKVRADRSEHQFSDRKRVPPKRQALQMLQES